MPNYDLESTIQDALHYLIPHDRETWYKTGMSIHAELGDAGYYLWDNWSRQDTRPAPHGYNATDAAAVWKSFTRGGGITIGTLWAVAKEWGWEPRSTVAVRTVAATPEPPPVEVDQEREQRVRNAATLAQRIILSCNNDTHPYLESKGFGDWKFLVASEPHPAWELSPNHPLLRWLESGPLLVIPMRHSRTNEVQSLQFINPKGDKWFLPDGRAGYAVYCMGAMQGTGPRWYCEGFATALAIREALRVLRRRGDQVRVCFSAGGVAKIAKDHPPDRRGFIVADHDEHICTSANCHHRWTAPWGVEQCPKCGCQRILPPTGERYALEAGLPYWVPPEPKFDAYDYAEKHGYRKLAEQLRQLAIY